MKYILALDQGTTSSRSILFNKRGEITAFAQKEFSQKFPQPGLVEHDPEEIWNTQMETAKEVIHKSAINIKEIAAIGITNQRETIVIWDRNTGIPIYNAIVWQDRRTSSFCDTLKEKGLEPLIKKKTGLVIDAYFSGTKIKWILDNVPNARKRAEQGDVCFGTIDTWLLWKLTKGKIHKTDITNASRTMLCDITALEWDKELQSILDIPSSILPQIYSSSGVFAYTDKSIFTEEIPISGVVGDQQSALFGQMCINPGMVKNTYGTGCFMLMNTGEKIIYSSHNLLTTVAWKIQETTHYALEGSVFIGGAVVQWLRDGLGIIKKSIDVELLAKEVDSNGGVYIVPAFTGMGAPYWEQDARGTITGLTRGSNAAHIARAALESIAYQTTDVLKAMQKDSNIPIQELRVDGGASKNDLLMQFQSDVLNTKVVRPTITETTALGAAYLAGLAVHFWKDREEIKELWDSEKTFIPNISREKREKLLYGWEKAIQSTIQWAR
ncbi:MAG: glycerol kinase GlpK [Chitinophagaceae bacterium]|nr:glycerol kinase GlpK [Chitinophagaceae bacterium]